LIFIVLDVLKPLQHKQILMRELEGFGIRLNTPPPNITFRRKEKGGINLQCAVSLRFAVHALTIKYYVYAEE
jgi:ribosome-interacting GTPase 1